MRGESLSQYEGSHHDGKAGPMVTPFMALDPEPLPPIFDGFTRRTITAYSSGAALIPKHVGLACRGWEYEHKERKGNCVGTMARVPARKK